VNPVSRISILLSLAGGLACDSQSEAQPVPVKETPVASPVEPPPEPPDPCLTEAEALVASVQLPGTPVFDEHRGEILARARSVPLVFGRVPEAPASSSERVLKFRKLLKESQRPAHDIQEVLRKTRRNFEERREVFLSEGYFYAETPLLALRLSQIIRLDHLFKREHLRIHRGDEILEVEREDGRYWLPPTAAPANSKRKPAHGALASLLLFDRVDLVEPASGAFRGHDLRALQSELGFSRAKVLARTPERWVLELDTYGVTSRAVISVSSEAPPALRCESALKPELEKALQEARSLALEDRALVAPVLASAHEFIARRLPFDEPRTEEGQQDGLLRIHFRKAYRRYKNTYEFNGDEYYVFDGYGRPRLPQVCIDFITDAFDWGTGGGWPNRGEKRLRRKGALHFGSLGIENPRSIENLAEFASEEPEWFEMKWVPKPEQVKFRAREKFFRALEESADDYRLGDVIFIYGLRDDQKFHYHSFLVDQKDPITGIPTVVLANAGPPQARSFEGEMQNAPLRKIVARMRVRREILRAAGIQAKKRPGVPLEGPSRPEREEQRKARSASKRKEPAPMKPLPKPEPARGDVELVNEPKLPQVQPPEPSELDPG